MSYKKMAHMCASERAIFFEQKIATVLRQKHDGKSSRVKRIFLKTGIAPGTIKRWYSSKKLPSLEHFLLLAQNYPAILQIFLEEVGHDYLIQHIRVREQGSEAAERAQKAGKDAGKNDTINDTIKPKAANLNERQAWFLESLQGGAKLTAHDICRQWSVFLRTSRRDIEELKELNIIRFRGAKKTGQYEVIK